MAGGSCLSRKVPYICIVNERGIDERSKRKKNKKKLVRNEKSPYL